MTSVITRRTLNWWIPIKTSDISCCRTNALIIHGELVILWSLKCDSYHVFRTSVYNRTEADFIVMLCSHLAVYFGPKQILNHIGIITPYQRQRRMLIDQLSRRLFAWLFYVQKDVMALDAHAFYHTGAIYMYMIIHRVQKKMKLQYF